MTAQKFSAAVRPPYTFNGFTSAEPTEWVGVRMRFEVEQQDGARQVAME